MYTNQSQWSLSVGRKCLPSTDKSQRSCHASIGVGVLFPLTMPRLSFLPLNAIFTKHSIWSLSYSLSFLVWILFWLPWIVITVTSDFLLSGRCVTSDVVDYLFLKPFFLHLQILDKINKLMFSFLSILYSSIPPPALPSIPCVFLLALILPTQ